MRNKTSLFHVVDFTPSVLALLGGILIALQLALPAIAFASSVRLAAPNPPADQAFALAEVSVVRLVVSYSSTAQPVGGQTLVPSVECTGLGVLVASWATTNPREENTWVLTDGDLVNKNRATCAQRTSAAQLVALQVYANNVYTSNLQGLLLSSSGFVPVTVRCSDTKTCSGGAALFAFHTDQPQPFLDRATSTTSQTTSFGIELTRDGSLSAIPAQSNAIPQQTVQYLQQMPQFLTPTKESSSSTLPNATPVELGMPLVDRNGSLVGIQLNASGVFSAGQITQFLAAQPELRPSSTHTNTLNMQWRQGMKDYYTGNFSSARQELTAAKTAAFTAPSLYLSSIATKTSGSSGGQSGTPASTGGVSIFGMQFSVLMLLLLSVAGLVLLIIILVLISLRFGAARAKRREELQRFKADEAQVRRIATTPPTMQRPQESWPSPPQPRPPQTPMASAPTVAHADTPGKEVIPPRAIPPGIQELRLQNTQTEPLPPATVSHTVPSHLQTETPHEQERHVLSKKEEIKRPEIIPEKPHERPEAGEKVEDRVGQQLGNYRLVRLLGRGGFAEVYLGEHLRLGTSAAVKVLHTRLANRSEVESFQKEAHTIASLEHPHIVRVFDFDVINGTPFLVMSYASGGTLRHHHPKGSILPLPTIISYVKQVAEALQYAHDEKLIHRDVKPENMLVGRRGEVLLSDFGIALVAQSSRYQSTQDMAGTIAYMAPEQIHGKPRPASDQYALGVIVYEWLSGDRPFHGSFTEIAAQHAIVPPPTLREKVPAITPDVEHVVLTTLAKDPKQRFGSIHAFAIALEQAIS
jgi:Protein kinase domain